MGLVMMRTHCRVTRAHVLLAARLRPRPAGRPERRSRRTTTNEACAWWSLSCTDPLDPLRSIQPHTASSAIATADVVRKKSPRFVKSLPLSMLTGSVLLRCSSFNRLAAFAAAAVTTTTTTASPRRRSSSTTGSTMELGDDYRTLFTSTNHHHALRCFSTDYFFTGG